MALRRVSISPHLLAFVGLLAASAAHAQPTSTNPLEIPSYNVAEVCSGMTARCVEEEQAALQDLSAVWPVLTASQLRYSLRQLMSMRDLDGSHPFAYYRLLTIAEGIARADDELREMGRPPLEPQ